VKDQPFAYLSHVIYTHPPRQELHIAHPIGFARILPIYLSFEFETQVKFPSQNPSEKEYYFLSALWTSDLPSLQGKLKSS